MHASLSIDLVKNQKGSALISITLSIVALVGMVSMIVVSQNQNKLKMMKQINVSNVAEQIKQKVLAAVLSPQAWQLTETNNSSAFSALPAAGAAGGGAIPLNLYLDSATTPYYSSSLQNMGFDQNGQVCDTFNSHRGNDECPFRYKVYVTSLEVINGSNVHTVRFDFEFKPSSSHILLNAKKADFSFSFKRNINARSVESACIAINGALNAGSSECTVNFKQDHNCISRGKAYTGLGGVAGEHCKTVRLISTTCPSGRVLKGFSHGGRAICDRPYDSL